MNNDAEQKITILEVIKNNYLCKLKIMIYNYNWILLFQNSKQYLEGNIKESENNLREMVQRKRVVGGEKENQPGSSKD